MAGRHSIATALGFVLATATSTASAGDFLPDGTFAFDPLAVDSFDFEDGELEPFAEGEEPLEPVESSTALSGTHVLTVGSFEFGGVWLKLPSAKRRYRASVWLRGEASTRVSLFHDDSGRTAEYASLYPTGRVTSDDWVEYANDDIRIDGTRSVALFGVFNHGGAPIDMDAIELVHQGAIDGEVNKPCSGVVDGAVCEPTQVCMWSECRNVGGMVPPIPQDRDDVARYLENRIRFLFGPYAERTLDLPAAIDALAGMHVADDPWGYWNSFFLAVRRLHDWHTNVNSIGFGFDNPRPINACFIEGDADLSQAVAPSDPLYRDIIVSHVGDEANLGLAAGDRLVRIDGKHPIAWARTLIDFNWDQPVISNHVTFAEYASRLRSMISRFAHEIEVVRCDTQSVSCGAVETIVISDLPAQDPDDAIAFVTCDNRPLRHLADSPEDHGGAGSDVFAGLINESDTVERVYGAEWSSLSTTNGQDGVGANLNAAIQLFESDGANGVILDHRTGFGGTLRGCDIIWDWAVATHPITYSQGRPTAEAEQPTIAEGQAIYQFGQSNGLVTFAGAASPTDIPVALLITLDGSASDWLPLGLKGASNVRIFGPYQTAGGFSTRYELGYGLGWGYVLASADTFTPAGNTLNGFGVEPDVVVTPKQSDLLVGVDTVFEAALDWVRQEMP